MDSNTKALMFSKKSDEWSTPDEFYALLDERFGPFTLDPCATQANAKCAKFYTMEDDGLSRSWQEETVFVNPPYSKVKDWVKKAYDETRWNEAKSDKSTMVVMLLPARTDTKMFHEYINGGAQWVFFIKGRLKFGGQKNSAPFPSMVAIFTDDFVETTTYYSTMERT